MTQPEKVFLKGSNNLNILHYYGFILQIREILTDPYLFLNFQHKPLRNEIGEQINITCLYVSIVN
jgi:hypothetical protein